MVVVVLRTPPAELSDAAVRPDQRHTSIATSSTALWTHEGGVAHRNGCVLVSGLGVCGPVGAGWFFRIWESMGCMALYVLTSSECVGCYNSKLSLLQNTWFSSFF